jgi:hypothetical protein
LVTKDTVPRWLRPVEPGYSANCQVEVDPTLCVNEKTARSLGECVKHIEREVTVLWRAVIQRPSPLKFLGKRKIIPAS